jgi:phosphoribosylformylglycinamidine cyclo-ligase
VSRGPRDDPDAGGLTYRGAGVDIEAKACLLESLVPVIRSTYTGAVALGAGGFAGAVRLEPPEAGTIVATIDGVGSKTLLARRLGRDAVVGADIVAHCANDLAAVGARPLAFLDYIAMPRLDPAVVGALVEGMAAACRSLGAVLIGGETAEMPGVYWEGAYDVVGTMIGTAPAGGLITGARVSPGDRLIGLASAGLHTNGYTLARRALEAAGVSLHDYLPELGGTPGDALLAPHLCYSPAVLSLVDRIGVRAASHITGGGLVDNLARVMPDGCRAVITRGWPQPPVFAWLQRVGRISDQEMVRTFNLGIGMVLVVSPDDAAEAVMHLQGAGLTALDIGEVTAGPRGVSLV